MKEEYWGILQETYFFFVIEMCRSNRKTHAKNVESNEITFDCELFMENAGGINSKKKVLKHQSFTS